MNIGCLSNDDGEGNKKIPSYQAGDMGVYGIGLFSCGTSVILILTCSFAVSSSTAVCGFS